MPKEDQIARRFTTRKFLDRMLEPPGYVDEELPTRTRKLSWPQRRGVTQRATQGTASATASIEGSLRITGSHYDFNEGSYSFRVTRLSVGVAGTNAFHGTTYDWYLRHSREGTIDRIPFGAQDRVFSVGGPKTPIYAVGPGTLIWGWRFPQAGTHVTLAQSMEGIFGVG